MKKLSSTDLPLTRDTPGRCASHADVFAFQAELSESGHRMASRGGWQRQSSAGY